MKYLLAILFFLILWFWGFPLYCDYLDAVYKKECLNAPIEEQQSEWCQEFL